MTGLGGLVMRLPRPLALSRNDDEGAEALQGCVIPRYVIASPHGGRGNLVNPALPRNGVAG